MNRKRTGAVLALTLATTAVVAPTSVYAAGRFSDVPQDRELQAAVEYMAQTGITIGCDPARPELYCPDDKLSRRQMALFLYRMSGNSPTGPNVNAQTLQGLTPEQLRGQISSSGTQGPQGPMGQTGSTGPAGPAGADGPAGPAGPQGVKGDTGAAGKDGLNGTPGVKGDTGAAGKDGLNGTPSAVRFDAARQAHTGSTTVAEGSTPTSVMKVAGLAAGAYSVNAKLVVVGQGSQFTLRCTLGDDVTEVLAVNNDSESLSLVDIVEVPANGSIEVLCTQVGNANGGLVRNRSMSAVAVASR